MSLERVDLLFAIGNVETFDEAKGENQHFEEVDQKGA